MSVNHKILNGSAKTICFVGGGPRFLYSFERMAAILAKKYADGELADKIEIHVFDQNGEFGSGTHNSQQPYSNWLNTIQRHHTRVPDESVLAANLEEYPTIITQKRLAEYAIELARLGNLRKSVDYDPEDPDDFPIRKVLGGFYVEAVNDIAASLEELTGGKARLVKHPAKVLDLITASDSMRYIQYVNNGKIDVKKIRVDTMILTTGHLDVTPDETEKELKKYADECGDNVHFMPANLSVSDSMAKENVPPGSSVGLLGTGLTTIDEILYLTEGRDGKWERDGAGKLKYIKAGDEPEKIVCFSPSGVFARAKGRNEKGDSQYKPHFFTFDKIDAARSEREKESGSQKLDFEYDAIPLILMDMANEFFRIRQGDDISRKFISAATEDGEFKPKFLTKDRIKLLRDRMLDGETASAKVKSNFVEEVVPLAQLDVEYFYYSATKGKEFADKFAEAVDIENPSHETDEMKRIRAQIEPDKKTFDIIPIVSPIREEDYKDLATYKAAVRQYMENDIAASKLGNQTSPEKAACSALNDMVDYIRYTVDHDGLTSRSLRTFYSVFDREIFRKIAVGPPFKSLEKLLALEEAGILDLSIGPVKPEKGVAMAEDSTGFTIQSSKFPEEIYKVQNLSFSRIPLFDPERELTGLYGKLMEQGFARYYENKDGTSAVPYRPGALDVDQQLRLIGKDGKPVEWAFAVGPNIEGIIWHSNLLARMVNHNAEERDISKLTDYQRLYQGGSMGWSIGAWVAEGALNNVGINFGTHSASEKKPTSAIRH